LFALVVWLLHRLPLAPLRQDGAMRITARLGLNSEQALIEVEHRQQRYLLAVSRSGLVQIDPARSLPAAGTPEASKIHQEETGAGA
ncbi:MAG: hypothetical protein R8K47_05705, partial [Mariprofundaceae bacterium]